ncbi:ADP-ribose pyrophosphatase [Frankia canadensis]|uniref:8-oxo-dGTP diphosphatase n=1 Tax=Frankia canadensis TaxID=1836972 RepID=A0A2I2KLZ7_9ACTN|nr:ADP-ribose pyrophosphatase [Frankia canadensis]SOU53978.1 ADP-ribose pyrophosphatase [Frankia canadensis]
MNADVSGQGACALPPPVTPPARSVTSGAVAAPASNEPEPVAQPVARPAAGPDPAPGRGRLVVAVALLDERRRVLAARRREPPAYAGMWEFPGGKVEPGETELDALVRECREELDVEIEVGPVLGEVELARPGWVLRVWFGRITGRVPRMVDHDELRWLSVAELYDVRWMPADGPLVDRLHQVLAGSDTVGWPAG